MKIALTGGGVLAAAGLLAAGVAVYVVKKNAGAVLDAVNPASDKNLVYRGVNAVAGEQNVASAADRIFGALDLVNPWNESDEYAKTVWGVK